MADTLNGETVTPEALENNANPVATPAVNAPDNAEVERLKKEAEQATLRANQLANQLKAKEEAEAAAKAKELEEQNKFKDLYEQEKAKREQIETDQAQAERQASIRTESDKLFAEYPEQVKALAEEAGMNLSDTDEDSVAAFKAKLDKVSSLVKQPKVTPNNPGVQTPHEELSPNDMHAMLNDPVKFDAYARKNLKGTAAMMRPTE
jgi:small-conductance mechanosensitive channel